MICWNILKPGTAQKQWSTFSEYTESKRNSSIFLENYNY